MYMVTVKLLNRLPNTKKKKRLSKLGITRLEALQLLILRETVVATDTLSFNVELSCTFRVMALANHMFSSSIEH